LDLPKRLNRHGERLSSLFWGCLLWGSDEFRRENEFSIFDSVGIYPPKGIFQRSMAKFNTKVSNTTIVFIKTVFLKIREERSEFPIVLFLPDAHHPR